jgi:hypothetical protein
MNGPLTSRRGFLAVGAGTPFQPAGRSSLVEMANLTHRWNAGLLEIKVDGREFAVYNYDHTHAGLYRPYFHPLMGPNDRPITQNGEFPGSLRGHYWHRGLFVAHQRLNTISFWEERQADCGRIAHLGFDPAGSGSPARMVERLAWLDLDGRDLIHERRTITVPPPSPAGRMLDLTLRLEAARDRVRMGATPYNLLACRVIDALAPVALKERYDKHFGRWADFSPLGEGGLVINSDGKTDDACRGARAKWCDISGPLGDGTWAGVTLMDHPANPRHPTPFHNWSNLTIMASFTFHEAYLLEPGRPLTLAYRVLVHADDVKKASVPEAWKAFSQTEPAGLSRKVE